MIAHIRKTDGAKQPLKIHCLQVGLLSKHMAQRLGLSAIAQLIVLLHDMGKATAAFAAYLISAAHTTDTKHDMASMEMNYSGGIENHEGNRNCAED